MGRDNENTKRENHGNTTFKWKLLFCFWTQLNFTLPLVCMDIWLLDIWISLCLFYCLLMYQVDLNNRMKSLFESILLQLWVFSLSSRFSEINCVWMKNVLHSYAPCIGGCEHKREVNFDTSNNPLSRVPSFCL